MDAKYPLVSIITLNYNQTEATCEFLESARALTYPNYEILVCDMASVVDPTERILSGNYLNTRVLRSEENLGFPGGNNWGIRQCGGEYIFIVNNDTEVTPGLLDILLEPFFRDPSIGVTCPKIRFFHSDRIIQYAGFNAMNLFTGRTTAVGNKESDHGQYDYSGPTHGAHGCAMMVSREVIGKTGMFPENFFLYYEEWDWSARILKAGYKIWYEGKGLIFHKESMSVGKKNPLKVYYHTRNRILYMRRNANFFQFSVFISFFVFFTAPKSILQFTLRKEFGFLRAFLKGALSNFRTSRYSRV
jgi:hypothetical protein